MLSSVYVTTKKMSDGGGMGDALDSESSEEIRGGSNPLRCIKE